jgi:hypothetical protein
VQQLPDVWPVARASGFAAVLELPLGDVYDDIAAMYRATVHAHPVVNGNSGFEPTHYLTLKTALEEHDPSALDGLPPGAPVLVVVDKKKDTNHEWEHFLSARSRVTAVGSDDRWAFFAAGPPPPAAPVCAGNSTPIVSVTSTDVRADLAVLTDRNPRTWWATSHPQRVGDALILDLGRKARPCAVIVSVGEFRRSYARKLIVDTSESGVEWNTVAEARAAGLTMRAALEDPKTVSIVIGLAPSTGRLVRLRLGESHPTVAWLVTDVAVRVAIGPE